MTTATIVFASANAAEITSPAAQTQVDANGKHPGESGYCYDATLQPTA
ncbi:MAG: hypothetical protein IKP47_05830 [Ruminococcus sp.]|nr:hypothetical protein [Ruminococcus sp.]